MSHPLFPYQTSVNPARIELLEMAGGPLDFVKASGSWLEDEDGRRYLDLWCGYGAATLGHRHPAVMAAIREALDGISPGHLGGPFINPKNVSRMAGILAEKLTTLAGAKLKKVYFGNSGSEGVEAALKFAMAHTNRSRFVSFEGAFHGFTLGALSLAGSEHLKRPFPARALESVQIPFADLNILEDHLKKGDIAGVVLEPVQGMTGARAWKSEDLVALQRLCRKHGTAVILDEVLTGIGRTGKWFAFQHTDGFEPDIVAVSKGLTGGAVPVSATLMTGEIYESVFRGIGRSEIHASTFEAHLLGAVAGTAVIKVIEEQNLFARIGEQSAKIEQAVGDLISAGAPISDLRGYGLLLSLGIDNTFDKDKEIWGAPGLRGRLLEKGVLTMVAAQDLTRINLLPPFVLGNWEVDYFIQQLATVFSNVG